MYQNITEGTFMFFDRELSKSSKFYYLQPGLYLYVTDNVEAMNTFIQERHNHNESCTRVEVSRRTQNVEIYLANEWCGPESCSTDLGHIFSSNVGNEIGVMLRGKGPCKPEFAYDMSAYTLSWYTRTWLSTTMMATRRQPGCVFFLPFQSSNLETLYLLNSTWAIGQ